MAILLGLLLVSVLGILFVVNKKNSNEESQEQSEIRTENESDSESMDVESSEDIEETGELDYEVEYLPFEVYAIEGMDTNHIKKTSTYTYDDKYKLIESVYYDDNENIMFKNIKEYDETGNVIEERDEYPNGTVSKTYSEYNSMGKIVKRIIEDEEGPGKVSIYEYDDKGENTQITILALEDNSQISSQLLEHDADGNITKVTNLGKNNEIISWSEYLYSDDIDIYNYYGADGNLKYGRKTYYDEKKRGISSEVFWAENGYWETESSAIYNDNEIIKANYSENTFDGYTECIYPEDTTEMQSTRAMASCEYSADGKIENQFFTKYLKVMKYSNGTAKATEVDFPGFDYFIKKRNSDQNIFIETSVDEGVDLIIDGVSVNNEKLTYCTWDESYNTIDTDVFTCKPNNKGVDIKINKNGVYNIDIGPTDLGNGTRKNEAIVKIEGKKEYVIDEDTMFFSHGETGMGSIGIVIINGEIFPAR